MFGIPLTLGIEEEYQIIHPDTRDLHSYVQEFLDQGRQVFPDGQLKPEFLQSQIEVGSYVCRNVKELREDVVRLRTKVSSLATDNNLRISAASTHPFAIWSDQTVTAGERYRKLLDQLAGVAAQLLIFGMHIHIGFGEGPGSKDLMIEVMNQLRYFLPHLLALSTSSPFWQGRNTGLKSYRSVIFEMLPRTGLPQTFSSYSEFIQFVELMGKVGSISDADSGFQPDPTKIWWDVRPHPKFGTLEVRIPDLCTKIDEAVCLAALVQALVAKLIRLCMKNQSWRSYRRHHILENKWRAMRYGIDGKLIDFGKEEEVPMRFLALELVDLVDDVVDDLDSRAEVEYVRTILQEGTSADRQLKVYHQALDRGATHADALHAVVDHLIQETLIGVPQSSN